MMDITDDEQLLFRTRAQIKGKEGEVVVTSTRLSFSTAAASDAKSFTWANIAGVKYSPANDAKGRAMVLLKTVIQGDEDVVITIVGPNKEQNFAQQEAMKSVISKIRKTGGKPTQSQKPMSAPPSTGPSGVKRGPSNADLLDAKRRKQLLESDRNFAKQYRDLVEVNKILTEEDFWAVHAQKLQLMSDASTTDQALSFKGKQNSLLAKSFDKDSNGIININLTVEMRQNIFAMYPEVRKAFDAEVPLKRSETEFWTVYLQSEYYNGMGTASSSSSDMPPQRDDLFARYSEKDDATGKKKKVDGMLQHSDVDLTASFGDYRAAEPVEATDTEESADGTGALLLARYNRSSGIVVGDLAQSVARSSKSAGKGSEEAQSTQLRELLRHSEPDYIQVRFKDTKSQPVPAAAAPKPTAGMSQQASILVALRLPDTRDALRGLETSVPSAERGSRLFTGAINLQKKVSARLTAAQGGRDPATAAVVSSCAAAEQFNPLEMLGLGEDSSSSRQIDEGIDEGSLLDENFKQVLKGPCIVCCFAR